MGLRTVDDKIDDAVYAAMEAVGLTVTGHMHLAVEVNEALRELLSGHITDDEEDE